MHPHPVILVAEDDHDTCQAIAAVLSTELSAHVLLAPNGRRLLELARGIRPAVVVTDLRMPEVDGLTALARLRDDPRTAQTPVVAVSDRLNRRAALDAGAWAFVPKPFDVDDLVRVVGDLLCLRPGGYALPQEQPA